MKLNCEFTQWQYADGKMFALDNRDESIKLEITRQSNNSLKMTVRRFDKHNIDRKVVDVFEKPPKNAAFGTLRNSSFGGKHIYLNNRKGNYSYDCNMMLCGENIRVVCKSTHITKQAYATICNNYYRKQLSNNTTPKEALSAL